MGAGRRGRGWGGGEIVGREGRGGDGERRGGEVMTRGGEVMRRGDEMR
jgi:hypothetical protein